MEEHKVDEIVEKFGTPIQVYSEKDIKSRTLKLLDIFKTKFGKEQFKQFYAVKALPNPNILKIITDLGCGLDCSSKTELYIAVEILKLDSSRILFTSNYTSDEDLLYAINKKVIINLDNINLIDKLEKISEKNLPELISLRYNLNINTETDVKSNILSGNLSKFGIDYKDIKNAYDKLKKLGIKKFGIHVMCGSNVLNNNYWNILLDNLYRTINELNINFEFINLGGGFGIPYKENEKELDLKKIAENIYEKIYFYSKKNNLKIPKIYMEHGRYLTGPAGWLISKCNSIKEKDNNIIYGLDSCMSNLMRPGMYDSYHKITVHKKKGNNINSSVVGTLCENNDWFAKNINLPNNIEEKDIFIIHDTGAHSHSMGFQYNGKLRCGEVLICEDNTLKLIRKNEDIEYYLQNIIYI